MPASPTNHKLMKFGVTVGFTAVLVAGALRKVRSSRFLMFLVSMARANYWVLESGDMKDYRLTPAGRIAAGVAAMKLQQNSGRRPIRVICKRGAKGYQTAQIVANVIGVELEFVDWTDGPRYEFDHGVAAVRLVDPRSVLVIVTDRFAVERDCDSHRLTDSLVGADA